MDIYCSEFLLDYVPQLFSNLFTYSELFWTVLEVSLRKCLLLTPAFVGWILFSLLIWRAGINVLFMCISWLTDLQWSEAFHFCRSRSPVLVDTYASKKFQSSFSFVSFKGGNKGGKEHLLKLARCPNLHWILCVYIFSALLGLLLGNCCILSCDQVQRWCISWTNQDKRKQLLLLLGWIKTWETKMWR